MPLTIGMFTTPKVIQLVVLTVLVPDPHKYILVGLAGATSAWSFRLVMTLANYEACLQPNLFTYLDSCSIMSVNCAASLEGPDVKNTSSYPLVGAQNVFFVVVGAPATSAPTTTKKTFRAPTKGYDDVFFTSGPSKDASQFTDMIEQLLRYVGTSGWN